MENKLTVTINKTQLPVKEYQGQRVVTMKEIDAVHQRPEGTARKRFNDNKRHFIEGVDYFKVPSNECPGIGQSIIDCAANSDGPRGIGYSGYIYIAFAPDSNLIKIGRTNNKAKRISTLNTGRTQKISEDEYFPCKDTLVAEKEVHRRFEAYREIGEWFSVPVDEARRAICGVVADVDAHFDPDKRHRGGARTYVTLITENGYLMLVKSFGDDLAWTVQRQLVNVYFRTTPEQRQEAAKKTPVSPMEYLRLVTQATFELDDRVTGLEDKVDKQMTIDHGQQRRLQRMIGERVYERAAETFPPSEVKTSVGPFFQAIYKDLKNCFGVPSYRDIRPVDYADAMAYVEHWIEPADVRDHTY